MGKQLVHRVPQPGDARRAVVALSEAGRRLTEHAADVNRAHALDVQADRRHGGSRRRWQSEDSK